MTFGMIVDSDQVEKLVRMIDQVGHVPMPGGYPIESSIPGTCSSFYSSPRGAFRSLVCLVLLGEDWVPRTVLKVRWTLLAGGWVKSFAPDLHKKLAERACSREREKARDSKEPPSKLCEEFSVYDRCSTSEACWIATRKLERRYLLEAMYRVVSRESPALASYAQSLKVAADSVQPKSSVPLIAEPPGWRPWNAERRAIALALEDPEGPGKAQALFFLHAVCVLLKLNLSFEKRDSRSTAGFYRKIARFLFSEKMGCPLRSTAAHLISVLNATDLQDLSVRLHTLHMDARSAPFSEILREGELPNLVLQKDLFGDEAALSLVHQALALADAFCSLVMDPCRAALQDREINADGTFYKYVLNNYRIQGIAPSFARLFARFEDGSIGKVMRECSGRARRAGMAVQGPEDGACGYCCGPRLVQG